MYKIVRHQKLIWLNIMQSMYQKSNGFIYIYIYIKSQLKISAS